MVSGSKVRASLPPPRRAALAPPASDFEVTAADLDRAAPPAFESGDYPCGQRRATPRGGLSSDLDDDAPTLARPTPAARSVPVESDVAPAIGGTVLRERFGAAVRYAERVVVVPLGTSLVDADALARAHANELRAALTDDAVGRYVRVAVFDHAFDHAPLRPPLADVSDKDWRAVPVPATPAPPAAATVAAPPASPVPAPRPEPRPAARAGSRRATLLAWGFGLTLGSIATSLLVEWVAAPPVSLRAATLRADP